ncbi:MAG: hypothetical protein KIT73_07445 [Burkholderiales bacterium]|nr:hypothetical protein [Burkholderiales bacterium]
MVRHIGLIVQLIAGQPLPRLDRVYCRGFRDSSLDFEVVFFVLDSGYGVYMDERQKLNLALMRGLAAMNVEFAFPTRTVHIASAPSTEPGPRPGEQESRTRWTAAN